MFNPGPVLEPSCSEIKPEEKSSTNINLSGLKAKLERMGTNVSVSPGNSNLKPKTSSEGSSGISVIRNGESFKLANIAEVKLNFDDSSRIPRSKPSCAVKPIVKPVPVKPSATVRPLNIQEALLKEKTDEENLTNGTEQTPPSPCKPEPEPLLHIEETPQEVAGAQCDSSEVITVEDHDDQVSGSSSQSESQTLCKDEDVEMSPATEDRGVILPAGEKESKLNLCRVVPCVAPQLNGNLGDTEDTFNADIVCHHGNLRIEERCKQLISRQVWFKLCSYFIQPKTFQFGKIFS